MFPTLLIIVPGLVFSSLIFSSHNLKNKLPIALGLGTGIFYFFTICLYLLTDLSFQGIANIYSVFSVTTALIFFVTAKGYVQKVWSDFLNITHHPLILILALGAFFLLTFWPPSGWDTITLYDFEAKLITDRTSFSQMLNLSQFDESNPTYYLSYPPLKSFIHAYYYHLNSNPVIYDFFAHLFTVFCLYLLIRTRGSVIQSLVLSIPYALNPIFINHIGFGYTNLIYAYLYFCLVYIIVCLTKFDLRLKYVFIFAFISSTLKLTRWVEPFYLIPVLSFMLITHGGVIKRISYSAVYLLIIHLLTYHWNKILISVPNQFIESNISKNVSLLVNNSSYLLKASNLFWTKFISYWPLLIIYLLFSVYLLVSKSSRPQKFLALVTILVFVAMYVGSVFVFLQLPNRMEIFDSLNRLPMFLLPIVWGSLGLLLI
jgi:hypothetical protein